MTLPLRRKPQIIAPNTRRQIPCRQLFSRHGLKTAGQALVVGASFALASQHISAQQWQPTRISPASQAQPLGADSRQPQAMERDTRTTRPSDREGSTSSHQYHGPTQQMGSGVVLRWRASNSGNSGNASPTPQPARLSSANEGPSAYPNQAVNPLRTSSVAEHTTSGFDRLPVRQVSDIHPIDRFQEIRSAPYQQSATNRPANASAQNSWTSGAAGRTTAGDVPRTTNRIASSFQQELPPISELPSPLPDPLDNAESAPEPPLSFERAPLDPPAFPPQLGEDESPADRQRSGSVRPESEVPEMLPRLDRAPATDPENDFSQEESEYDLDTILQQARDASIPNCVSQREQLKGQPLNSISLDVSPRLGDGLSSLQGQFSESQEKKEEISSRSLRREWTDYRGDRLASGRMIDFRYGNIILDVDGREQAIPAMDLSDVDMNYVSDLWNLPFRCGSGFEPLEGRQFIGSTVQWKASGACHNPLYFEQVQLERYGHETGPVLQPLISSAHFLLTIPMMPYKMAINPPNECQYALGYYRPGNCAPYMVQPFPWSVRAGLVQAGVVTGAAALLP